MPMSACGLSLHDTHHIFSQQTTYLATVAKITAKIGIQAVFTLDYTPQSEVHKII